MKIIILIARIFVSIAIAAAVVLQLNGTYPGAVNVAIPLLGLLMLLQGVSEWRYNRGAAWLSFCAAGFILIISLVVFFL